MAYILYVTKALYKTKRLFFLLESQLNFQSSLFFLQLWLAFFFLLKPLVILSFSWKSKLNFTSWISSLPKWNKLFYFFSFFTQLTSKPHLFFANKMIPHPISAVPGPTQGPLQSSPQSSPSAPKEGTAPPSEEEKLIPPTLQHYPILISQEDVRTAAIIFD